MIIAINIGRFREGQMQLITAFVCAFDGLRLGACVGDGPTPKHSHTMGLLVGWDEYRKQCHIKIMIRQLITMRLKNSIVITYIGSWWIGRAGSWL